MSNNFLKLNEKKLLLVNKIYLFSLYRPTTTRNLRVGYGRDMLMLVYRNPVYNQFSNSLSKLTEVWSSLLY